MEEKVLPPWAGQIPQGDFISYEPTYKVGEYFSRFHKEYFKPKDFEKLGYYFYDPTEHGFEKGREYPLLIFFHGYTNALAGDVCINYAGAEFYAKDEYQKALGGAYILIPLANEVRGEDGSVIGSWDESYIRPVYDLICDFIGSHAAKNGGVGKKVVFGNSRGSSMCFKMVDAYTDFFNALVPIATADISTDQMLDRYDQNDVWLFYAISRHDEFNDYEKVVLPRLPRLRKMKHCFIFIPEWVRNGDHGIASLNFGVEMGQHCLINPMHCNMMFDDGTPMEDSLPQGVTGWLSDMLKS
ncbi:MAG: hypothetical protein J6S91_09015 [Treponema sp.]|nr:hypothetical protein [Treponema sp.]